MRRIILLIVSAVLTAYVLLGGLLFHWLESEDEGKLRNSTNQHIKEFLIRNPCVNGEDLGKLVEVILDAKAKGGTLGTNASVNFNNWGFLSATFFSTTVVTTIGYGTIVPITDPGRVVCIIYALFGIPLCLVVLTGLGELMTGFIKKTIYKRFGCETKKSKALCVVGYLIAGTILFMLVPSAVWAVTQGWNYFDSFYYSFISLSTIGFGDFVLSAHPKMIIMRFFTSFWLFFGLSWLSSILAMISDMLVESTEAAVERGVSLHHKQKDDSDQKGDNDESPEQFQSETPHVT